MTKVGILLDRDGNEIPTRPVSKPIGLTVGPIIASVLGAAFIALIAFAGMTILGTLLLLFFAVWIVRAVLSLFGFSRPRSRTGNVVFYSVRKGR